MKEIQTYERDPDIRKNDLREIVQMVKSNADRAQAAGRRQIGAIGTFARVVLGLILLASGVLGGQVILINGQLRSHFQLLSFILGVVAFPLLLLGLQWLRIRLAPARLQATSPVSQVLNILIFIALVLTPLYAPQVAFLGYAAQVFYGASLLAAALRGYAGCEVLAISNWILGREDQVGCLALGPLDYAEHRLRGGQVQ
jgi:FtsH-binding integral membrane protein